MSRIRPFNALRPPADVAGYVACLPYDVMNREEARSMAQGNEKSFLHVVRADIDLPDQIAEQDECVQRLAARNFASMYEQKLLQPQGKAAYYLYRQERDGYCRTGLIACLPFEDYENGVIRRHELTRHDKEEDRMRHFDLCNAQTAAVFLTYRERPEITALIRQLCARLPQDCHFKGPDETWQTVYTVCDPEDMRALEAAFAAIPTYYIADGHHRAASAARIGRDRATGTPQESDYIMAGIFADTELRILPYHRLVRDLNGMSPKEFIAACHHDFLVEGPFPDVVEPGQKYEYGLFLENNWYRLRSRILPNGQNDPLTALDVTIIQDRLLDKILGIKDPRRDARLDFVGGARGLAELERRCRRDMRLAIAMPPTQMKELLEVSDRGEIMPPKSSWFEPKLLSGLFIHPYHLP